MTPQELKDWRIARGLSRTQLGRMIKQSPQTIEAWERGNNPMHVWLPLVIAAIELIE